jgi:hypothetical protein
MAIRDLIPGRARVSALCRRPGINLQDKHTIDPRSTLEPDR